MKKWGKESWETEYCVYTFWVRMTWRTPLTRRKPRTIRFKVAHVFGFHHEMDYIRFALIVATQVHGANVGVFVGDDGGQLFQHAAASAVDNDLDRIAQRLSGSLGRARPFHVDAPVPLRKAGSAHSVCQRAQEYNCGAVNPLTQFPALPMVRRLLRMDIEEPYPDVKSARRPVFRKRSCAFFKYARLDVFPGPR